MVIVATNAIDPSFAVIVGATLWGVISGVWTGFFMARVLAVEEKQRLSTDPALARSIGSSRFLQTWLPILTGLAAIAAAIGSVAVLTR